MDAMADYTFCLVIYMPQLLLDNRGNLPGSLFQKVVVAKKY
jgi:hypothetical protein